VGVPVVEASVALQGRGRGADGGCFCGEGYRERQVMTSQGGHPGDPLRRMWAGIFPPWGQEEGSEGGCSERGVEQVVWTAQAGSS
jgi:hypothetical protein